MNSRVKQIPYGAARVSAAKFKILTRVDEIVDGLNAAGFDGGHFLDLLFDEVNAAAKTEQQDAEDAEIVALLRQRHKAGVRLNPAEGGKAVEKVAEATDESPETVRTRGYLRDIPKPTKCDICDAPFQSKGEMKAHRRNATVHLLVGLPRERGR